MSYTSAEGRSQLLDELAAGADQIAVAIAALSDAYERVDEDAGDRLEEQLFRPAQAAYARAKRTYAEFAARHRLATRQFDRMVPAGRPAEDPRDAVERAADAFDRADIALAELQDSLLPVEVGDPEVRAGISEVRTVIAPLPARARGLVRTLGR